jgi:SAM-dependent methyltransferase
MFLAHGNVVYAVEPNRDMRTAAEAALAKYPRFHSVVGMAEATGLADRSVDYVVAAQAFHWFDAQATRSEFTRILRPPGWVVLIWNTRRVDTTPFLRAYEALLQQFGTDYRQVDHRNIDEARLQAFFAAGRFERHILENEQVFDLAGLRGRLCSSSYTPPRDDPRHEPMLAALEQIFRDHQQNGLVRFEYDTELYFGQIR